MKGYPQYLKYFMWGWQVHFRIACQTRAESLFNELDRGLEPNVFLIGFRYDPDEKKHPICIDPEDLKYRIDEFKCVDAIAQEIYNADDDRNMFYTGEGMQEEMDERLKRKCFRLALEKILNDSTENINKIYFVAPGAGVNGYKVHVVLELNRQVYESHLYLKKTILENRVSIYRSLLETAVLTYLDETAQELNSPEPGKGLGSSRTSEELLRKAAIHIMYTISAKGEEFYGFHGLLDACHRISVSRYEGEENYGHIIVAKEDHPDLEMTLELKEPFLIRDHRRTRKLLQQSNKEIGVVSNSYKIFGLGRAKNTYDPLSESIFDIFFRGVHCWDVFHNGQCLFQMRYGLPEFFRETISKEKFISDSQRLFQGISSMQIETLYDISLVATQQKKGSMLVIVQDAEEESKRLSKQCFCIKPVKFTKELFLELSSIDGAILADIDGFIHAYGVILDGTVKTQGDSSRGSRYNSAVTYCENRNPDKPTIIVVVSEDGMVDIIPTLIPQIRHSEILQIIDMLRALSEKSEFEPAPFNNAMEWLNRRQFYLTQTECDEINELRRNIESKIPHDVNLRIVHEDLHSNPEMNDSYYLNKN